MIGPYSSLSSFLKGIAIAGPDFIDLRTKVSTKELIIRRIPSLDSFRTEFIFSFGENLGLNSSCV